VPALRRAEALEENLSAMTGAAARESKSVDESTPAVASGPLTFPSNRALQVTSAPVAGTLRVAVVGDSMAYGAGLPYQQSLAARAVAHLNGALPEIWVEALTFGSPGACGYHSVGRAIARALPARPDILVLSFCCNDALMLAPQPPTAEEIGRTWIDFRPLLQTTLETFRDAVRGAGVHALVLFHDRVQELGGVAMSGTLAKLCETLELPFVDGAALLTGYNTDNITVSAADGHLNGFANDVIARQVAQVIIGRQWVPPSRGFADGRWMERIEHAAALRVRSGLPGALAFGDALTVLERKWKHRRNTSRREHEPRYTAVRERLLDRQRESLSRLTASLCGQLLRDEMPVAAFTGVETATNEALAASFAFEHVVASNGHADVLPHINYLSADTPVDLERSQSQWNRVRDDAEQLRATVVEIASAGSETRDCPSVEYLTFWSSRVTQWCVAAETCGRRYADLLPQVPRHLVNGMEGVLAYAHGRAEKIAGHIGQLTKLAQRVNAMQKAVPRIAGAGSLAIEFTLSAREGVDLWGVNVGVEGYAPAFSERHIGCFNVIRDGCAHSYRLDIPLMLQGDVHVDIFGPGVSDRESGLQVFPGRLLWLMEKELAVPMPALTAEAATKDRVSLSYRRFITVPSF
jgi:hypothetical protein